MNVTKSIEKTEEEITAALTDIKIDEGQEENKIDKLFYKRIARHYLADEVRKEDREAQLTSAAYHKKTKILITGRWGVC